MLHRNSCAEHSRSSSSAGARRDRGGSDLASRDRADSAPARTNELFLPRAAGSRLPATRTVRLGAVEVGSRDAHSWRAVVAGDGRTRRGRRGGVAPAAPGFSAVIETDDAGGTDSSGTGMGADGSTAGNSTGGDSTAVDSTAATAAAGGFDGRRLNGRRLNDRHGRDDRLVGAAGRVGPCLGRVARLARFGGGQLVHRRRGQRGRGGGDHDSRVHRHTRGAPIKRAAPSALYKRRRVALNVRQQCPPRPRARRAGWSRPRAAAAAAPHAARDAPRGPCRGRAESRPR